MADEKRQKKLSICRKILGYLGVIFFSRIALNLVYKFKRRITSRSIPSCRNSPFSMYVVFNGLNSSLCDFTLFLDQSKAILQQFITLGYRVIYVCQRGIKTDIWDMILKIKQDLNITEDIIVLKTFREDFTRNNFDAAIISDYCKKKMEIIGKYFILFNYCSLLNNLNTIDENRIANNIDIGIGIITQLFNQYIFLSTMFIKTIIEKMIRNKGEFYIIGMCDKIRNKSSCDFNRMSYVYFKNLHKSLRTEYKNKIKITFVKNIQNDFLSNTCVNPINRSSLDKSTVTMNSNFTINEIILLEIDRINLNQSKNIQFNSIYSYINYHFFVKCF